MTRAFSVRIGIAIVVTGAIVSCAGEPALLREEKKSNLVRDLSQQLIESAEAEKRAVLATTDEESTTFATESRHAAAEVDRLRAELGPLIEADARSSEKDALAAFDRAWSGVKVIDARLLELAVANTNLKAARLTVSEGAAELDRLIAALGAMAESSTDSTLLRDLSAAGYAALRVQSLLLEHIPLADSEAMATIERRIDELAARVDRVLAACAERVPPPTETFAGARAWHEYRRIAAEVIRLSRQNTNVISFDLAVHEKHDATKAALDALSSLRAAMDAVPHPTR